MNSLQLLTQQIESAKIPKDFPIRLVAVDGRGGAGKSTLAAKLAESLRAEVLRVDDFASWDNTETWTERFIKDIIEPIKAGAKTLNYVCSSWWPDHHPEPVKNQPVTPMMILEGVRSLRKELRPYIAFGIWVETPKETCLKRGLERDGQEAYEQWQKWFTQEDIYFAQDDPKGHADTIVKGT